MQRWFGKLEFEVLNPLNHVTVNKWNTLLFTSQYLDTLIVHSPSNLNVLYT